MSRFVDANPNQPLLLPVDLREWVPEDDMVHFVLEAVERIPLERFRINERGTGSAQYHPRMMLALLIYCYANGVFGSRRIERATYRDLAVRYLCADTHPDHDTICKFRRENFEAISEAFLQVLLLARELKLLKIGTISVDGTKIDAYASKHRNVGYDRAGELIEQLEADIGERMQQAEAADWQEDEQGQRLPEALSRRQKLKQQLQEAQARLEAQARAKAERERAKHERKLQARARRPGKRRGPKPKPPKEAVEPERQINLTDPDSALMRKNKGSEYRQSYNAQASVSADGSQLIVGAHLTNAASDRRELVKAVESVSPLLGRVHSVLADSGYATGEEVEALERQHREVLVAVGRERRRRYDFRPEPPVKVPPKRSQPWVRRMKERLESERGKSKYRLRKQTVEPAFGIIKEPMGFRRFLLRGLEKVQGEWQLVCLAYNCKRLHQLLQTA